MATPLFDDFRLTNVISDTSKGTYGCPADGDRMKFLPLALGGSERGLIGNRYAFAFDKVGENTSCLLNSSGSGATNLPWPFSTRARGGRGMGWVTGSAR